jgi:hypothetical protein
LYGPRARLVAANRTPRGVQVIVTVPFHLGRAEDAECA